MRSLPKIRFSVRTSLIATTAIATYIAIVLPPHLQNKHAIDVIVFEHHASFMPQQSHGPLWMRAMLPAEYTMGIDYLYFDSPEFDDSSLSAVAQSILRLASPVRRIELHGTAVTATGLEELRLLLPDCDVVAIPPDRAANTRQRIDTGEE